VTSAALRAQFPILERVAYLNAGTDGPVPRAAQEAAARELESELAEGRGRAHFERRFELQDELRTGYAELLGATVDDIALTTSTSSARCWRAWRSARVTRSSPLTRSTPG
jgi:L-cysteine/cystine lyase